MLGRTRSEGPSNRLPSRRSITLSGHALLQVPGRVGQSGLVIDADPTKVVATGRAPLKPLRPRSPHKQHAVGGKMERYPWPGLRRGPHCIHCGLLHPGRTPWRRPRDDQSPAPLGGGRSRPVEEDGRGTAGPLSPVTPDDIARQGMHLQGLRPSPASLV